MDAEILQKVNASLAQSNGEFIFINLLPDGRVNRMGNVDQKNMKLFWMELERVKISLLTDRIDFLSQEEKPGKGVIVMKKKGKGGKGGKKC